MTKIPVVMVPVHALYEKTSLEASHCSFCDVWAMMLAGLPREKNAKLSIHFIKLRQ